MWYFTTNEVDNEPNTFQVMVENTPKVFEDVFLDPLTGYSVMVTCDVNVWTLNINCDMYANSLLHSNSLPVEIAGLSFGHDQDTPGTGFELHESSSAKFDHLYIFGEVLSASDWVGALCTCSDFPDSCICFCEPLDSDSDGSCDALTAGCTDSLTCNFDVDAESDNGSCFYLGETCDDGDMETVFDVIQPDCLCSGVPIVPGCISHCACNYIESANVDDGSCEYESCAGCTYVSAANFDSFATYDDGPCTFESSNEPCLFVNNDNLLAFYPLTGDPADSSGNGIDGVVTGANILAN